KLPTRKARVSSHHHKPHVSKTGCQSTMTSLSKGKFTPAPRLEFWGCDPQVLRCRSYAFWLQWTTSIHATPPTDIVALPQSGKSATLNSSHPSRWYRCLFSLHFSSVKLGLCHKETEISSQY